MKNFLVTPNEKFIREVRPVIISALRKSGKFFKPKKQIQISTDYTNDVFITKRMNGSSGITTSGTFIAVSVNPKIKGWKAALFGTVAHEYNHAARAQLLDYKFDKTYTLLDHVALEGLGQCFEEFMTGITPPYAKAIPLKKAKYFWKKMKPLLKMANWDLNKRIFLDMHDKTFPHWCGYTVSYLIVKNKVEELNYDWKKLIKMSSKELVGKGL